MRDFAANPLPQPLVGSELQPWRGASAHGAPAAGANVRGLTTDLIRYLLYGQLPVNWPGAGGGLPAYPGQQGARPDPTSYVIVPCYHQKFTQAEFPYLAHALSSDRAIYGQGFFDNAAVPIVLYVTMTSCQRYRSSTSWARRWASLSGH